MSKEQAKQAQEAAREVTEVVATEQDPAVTPENETALTLDNFAPVDETSLEIVTEKTLMDAISGGPQAFLSSYPQDGTRETGLKIYNAINSTTGNISDLKKPVTVTNMLAHKVPLLDEQTGEVRDVIRLVLVTEDGESYGSVAGGVLSSMQKIVNIPGIGAAPWNPGLTILPRPVKTRNGFTTVTLELL